jgi:hypothetical protein
VQVPDGLKTMPVAVLAAKKEAEDPHFCQEPSASFGSFWSDLVEFATNLPSY